LPALDDPSVVDDAIAWGMPAIKVMVTNVQANNIGFNMKETRMVVSLLYVMLTMRLLPLVGFVILVEFLILPAGPYKAILWRINVRRSKG
jgi:hypothetical protein